MGLDTVQLIFAIEEEFGVRIPNQAAAKLGTVGSISAYVRARIESERGRSLSETDRAAIWERVRRVVVEEFLVAPDAVTADAHVVDRSRPGGSWPVWPRAFRAAPD